MNEDLVKGGGSLKAFPGRGGSTADGSRFDENALTCTTRDRKFGRYYKVTNLANGKSVVVRKRDFGPAKKFKGRKFKRVIDLSKAAFGRIADHRKGLIWVKVEHHSDSSGKRGPS